MDEELHSILTFTLLPQLISEIKEKENIDEISATRLLYNSKLYSLLMIQDLDLWHYSPLTLYNLLKDELETGKFNFPEET